MRFGPHRDWPEFRTWFLELHGILYELDYPGLLIHELFVHDWQRGLHPLQSAMEFAGSMGFYVNPFTPASRRKLMRSEAALAIFPQRRR
jgi:hypothetical protein